MKKNSSLRLKLHRETLRALAGPELEAAPGGVTSIVVFTQTCYNCPVLTNGCPTMVQNCTTHC